MTAVHKGRKAGSLQTGEVTEDAASASAREARAGHLVINVYCRAVSHCYVATGIDEHPCTDLEMSYIQKRLLLFATAPLG